MKTLFLRTKFFHVLTNDQLVKKIDTPVFVRAEVYCRGRSLKERLEVEQPDEVSGWNHDMFLQNLSKLLDDSVGVRIESYDGKYLYRESHEKANGRWCESEFRVMPQGERRASQLLCIRPMDIVERFYEDARIQAIGLRGELWRQQYGKRS